MKRKILSCVLAFAFVLTIFGAITPEAEAERTKEGQSADCAGAIQDDVETFEEDNSELTNDFGLKIEMVGDHLVSLGFISESENGSLSLRKDLLIDGESKLPYVSDFYPYQDGLILAIQDSLLYYDLDSGCSEVLAEGVFLRDLCVKNGLIAGIDDSNGLAQLVFFDVNQRNLIYTNILGTNFYIWDENKITADVVVSETVFCSLLETVLTFTMEDVLYHADQITGFDNGMENLLNSGSVDVSEPNRIPDPFETNSAPVFVVKAEAIQPAVLDITRLNVSNGLHHSNALDISGFGDFKAPFDGTLVYKSNDVPTNCHGIFLQSNSNVQFANGTVSRMTVLTMHDVDISDLYVGQPISQGKPYTQEGNFGDPCYGVHTHLECIQGTVGANAWDSRGNILPNNALYVSKSTRIENTGGYNWTVLSSYTASALLELTSRFNGESRTSLGTFGTADVYINGIKVADDTSYYHETHPVGTPYLITDVKPDDCISFNGMVGAAYSGTIGSGGVNVICDFTTIRQENMPAETKRKQLHRSEYVYFDTPVTWFEAKRYCELLGGYLVSIDDAQENEFVWNLADHSYAWIGGSDAGQEGNWSWCSEGSFSYTAWSPGQPDNSGGRSGTSGANEEYGEHYAQFWTDGKWNDNMGHLKYPFVCEIRLPVIAHGECGDKMGWRITGTELFINGFDEMWDFTEEGGPWSAYKDRITTIVFHPRVTEIGNNAFVEFTNLKEVVFPDTLNRIGSAAFGTCTQLESIWLPDGLTEISDLTFCNCLSLKSVRIPRSVTHIGAFAFMYCYNLTSVRYGGSRSDRNKIQIDVGNDMLNNAEWTYDLSDFIILGDMDGNGNMTSDDAIYLLRYALMPSQYPLSQNGDVNGDNLVTTDDAIYLLRHILNPSAYPLHTGSAIIPFDPGILR